MADTPENSCRISIVTGDRVVVPDDVKLMTPFILLEQEDWFEDEIAFIRRLSEPGYRALDIGANYGLYSLALARGAGEGGHVWAFEPHPVTAAHLKATIAANGLSNIRVIEAALSREDGHGRFLSFSNAELNELVFDGGDAEPKDGATVIDIPVRTLDGITGEIGTDWSDQPIDFVKLDAEGAEQFIIEGGQAFFGTQSPLVMFEISHAGRDNHADIMDAFEALEYGFYVLIPGLQILAPLDRSALVEKGQLNVFACKADRAEKLTRRGLLVAAPSGKPPSIPAADARLLAEAQPWCRRYQDDWQRFFEANLSDPNTKALMAFAVSKDARRPIAERYHALDYAWQTISAKLQALGADIGFDVACTAVRIASDLGMRAYRNRILGAGAQTLLSDQPPGVTMPFLAPTQSFDTSDVSLGFSEWLKAGLLKAAVEHLAFSMYFAGNRLQPHLLALVQSRFASPVDYRRWALLSILSGAGLPQALAFLAEDKPGNRNAWFWQRHLGAAQPATAAET